MNTSTMRSRWVRPATVKAAAAFSLVLALGVVSTAPAFGDDRDHHPRQNHGNQYASSRQGHNGNWQGNQRYDHARDHRDYRDNRGYRGYRGYRDDRGNYYDNQRYVYAPPPVAYVPQPAPGISLFFPLQIR